MKLSIYQLLSELQSFVSINDQVMDIAHKSEISTENSMLFRQYVEDWENGVYDEDPDILVQDILCLL